MKRCSTSLVIKETQMMKFLRLSFMTLINYNMKIIENPLPELFHSQHFKQDVQKESQNNQRHMRKRVSKINQVDRGHIYRAFSAGICLGLHLRKSTWLFILRIEHWRKTLSKNYLKF